MANVLAGQQFPFDPTGKLASNKITREFHVITEANWRSYHFIVPKKGPYFEDSLVMTYRNTANQIITLQKGIDWVPSYWFLGASRSCAKNIYGGITFINTRLTGNIEIAYQTIGGEWVLDDTAIAEILANRLNNPLTTTWEVIANVPKVFPPTPHEWDLIDMVGEEEVVEALYEIVELMRTRSQEGLQLHLQDNNNPHQVTKAQVGLGLVQNLPLAALSTVADDTGNNKYITPASARILINSLAVTPFTAHANDRNNPHAVTAEQVGAYTKAAINQMMIEKLGVTDIAFDTQRFAGKNYTEAKADILTGTSSNSVLFNGRSYEQLLAELTASATANETFGGRTPSAYRDWVLTGIAANANELEGLNKNELVAWMNAEQNIDAGRLNGLTAEEIINRVASSSSIDATTFGGMTAAEFAQWLVNGSGVDIEATVIAGVPVYEFLDTILNGTVSNANTVGGKTVEDIISIVQAGVSDAETLTGYTVGDIVSEARSGTVANASSVYGMNQSQLEEWIRSFSVANANTLDGRTFQDIIDYIAVSATANNATTLEGSSKEDLTNEIKDAVDSGIAELVNNIVSGYAGLTDAVTLEGRNSEALKAWILSEGIENARMLEGKTVNNIKKETKLEIADKFISRADIRFNDEAFADDKTYVPILNVRTDDLGGTKSAWVNFRVSNLIASLGETFDATFYLNVGNVISGIDIPKPNRVLVNTDKITNNSSSKVENVLVSIPKVLTKVEDGYFSVMLELNQLYSSSSGFNYKVAIETIGSNNNVDLLANEESIIDSITLESSEVTAFTEATFNHDFEVTNDNIAFTGLGSSINSVNTNLDKKLNIDGTNKMTKPVTVAQTGAAYTPFIKAEQTASGTTVDIAELQLICGNNRAVRLKVGTNGTTDNDYYVEFPKTNGIKQVAYADEVTAAIAEAKSEVINTANNLYAKKTVITALETKTNDNTDRVAFSSIADTVIDISNSTYADASASDTTIPISLSRGEVFRLNLENDTNRIFNFDITPRTLPESYRTGANVTGVGVMQYATLYFTYTGNAIIGWPSGARFLGGSTPVFQTGKTYAISISAFMTHTANSFSEMYINVVQTL